jgi:hypothetical protein
MKVSNFSVSITTDAGALDITDQVRNINITESLFGDLQGSIEVVDGVGLLETAISSQNKVIIKYDYVSQNTLLQFYINGVTSVDVSSSVLKKMYVINLRSINDMVNSMRLIAKSFKGKSTEIIKLIHEEMFGEGTINVITDSATQGRYIAPNISPKKAIDQLKRQAYDRDNNPFFIFQRLVDNARSTLNSLKQIEGQTPLFEIGPVIIDNKRMNISSNSQIGYAEKIIVHSDHENMDFKIANGIYGKSVTNIDISNSELSKTQYGVYTNAVSVSHPVRMDMYTDDVRPLLNSDDYYNVCSMNTILSTTFNTRVTAYHCTAIPNLGVGGTIVLNLPKRRIGQGTDAKFTGHYIISKIIHRIDDGTYTQIIEMARS